MYRLLLCVFLLVGTVHAQNLPTDESGNVRFQRVVELGDTSQTSKVLATKARSWVVRAFKSANDVIQQYEPADGILIAKGNSNLSYTITYRSMGMTSAAPVNQRLYFMLTIETKAGRYRATIDQLTVKSPATAYTPEMEAPIKAEATTEEQAYEQMRAVKTPMFGDKAKRTWAKQTVENQERLRSLVVSTCEGLLSDLETFMRQKSDKKDW
ncbi:DUF4468 domain-containing protein [Rudanella paleaurantiibacter]|uniref:DUF4468 domain-containing protein n=1 Tax=Rudanella paleaurantiibacter TaxID=2614655 RepID=A0A7J5TVH9_9BACT|nr:DUF4468 domain-containing protein [Rudanella paleaurantiibacter]KAB7728160.1 DUF4468 domain-containing protein [Rudanella paleaurantiibacter]